MFKLFRSPTPDETAPDARSGLHKLEPTGQDEDAPDFPLAARIKYVNGLPYVDWKAVGAWIATLPPELHPAAWSSCSTAWLLELKGALGPQYRLDEGKRTALLSSIEPALAPVTLDFMDKTSMRITRLLDGVAAPGEGRSILVVFDDEDSYYNYVSYYYPEKGEFALSGGMYIDSGLGHFVTVKSDLHSVEPVIAHEMTHASVARLPLPLWLNEGLAVNTERALTWSGRPLRAPDEMHRRHLAFWGSPEIQEFWSGKSFSRTDEGSELSYDLAQIMVEQMAKDWPAFRAFVLAANRSDSGAQAARVRLGVDLGSYVCALLEKDDARGWAPDPSSWAREDGVPAPARRVARRHA